MININKVKGKMIRSKGYSHATTESFEQFVVAKGERVLKSLFEYPNGEVRYNNYQKGYEIFYNEDKTLETVKTNRTRDRVVTQTVGAGEIKLEFHSSGKVFWTAPATYHELSAFAAKNLRRRYGRASPETELLAAQATNGSLR